MGTGGAADGWTVSPRRYDLAGGGAPPPWTRVSSWGEKMKLTEGNMGLRSFWNANIWVPDPSPLSSNTCLGRPPPPEEAYSGGALAPGGRLQPVLMRHPPQLSVKTWGGGGGDLIKKQTNFGGGQLGGGSSRVGGGGGQAGGRGGGGVRTVFSRDTSWWPTRHHYLSKPRGGGCRIQGPGLAAPPGSLAGLQPR